MVSGIVIFGLWAGIIANAFADELQRRHFLKTWDLVTDVPFFQSLGAAAIADIVRLLHARDLAAGTVVIRKGEAGDSMYFIVSGEAIRPGRARTGHAQARRILRRDGAAVRHPALDLVVAPAQRAAGARPRRFPRARRHGVRN